MNTTIALDAMGGDHGLDTVLPAAALALERHADLQLILVGRRTEIEAHPAFAALSTQERIHIEHSDNIITMNDAPADVLRHKTDTSMHRAIELVRDAQAAACVSAGNTGALMAVSRMILKTLPDISRPAICSAVPNLHGRSVHWLDLGANVDCKPQQLLQFAVMGSILSHAINGIESPRVGLLNVGEESIKGNEVVKETHKLLQARCDLNYIGFVEGNDIFTRNDLNVVVCDGFAGNVALKSIEGLTKFIRHLIKQELSANLPRKLLGLLLLPMVKSLASKIDARNYNGASLLGLQGIVVKSHGNADVYAFANAINIAILESRLGVPQYIRNALQHTSEVKNSA